MRVKIRYTVRALPETPGSKKIVWRVYDTERASYPIMWGGRRFEHSYPNEATAQAVADDLNKEES